MTCSHLGSPCPSLGLHFPQWNDEAKVSGVVLKSLLRLKSWLKLWGSGLRVLGRPVPSLTPLKPQAVSQIFGQPRHLLAHGVTQMFP